MYSYRRRDEGFGICGSKNVYSSNVRLGNWREDVYGEELASKPRSAHISSETVYSSSYAPIDARPEPPPFPAKMPKPFELYMKNKEGTPYHVIFNDGGKALSAEERFRSINRLSFSGDQVMQSYAVPDGYLRSQKQQQFQNDVDCSMKMITETKAALAYAEEMLAKKPHPTEKKPSASLPDWRRRKHRLR